MVIDKVVTKKRIERVIRFFNYHNMTAQRRPLETQWIYRAFIENLLHHRWWILENKGNSYCHNYEKVFTDEVTGMKERREREKNAQNQDKNKGGKGNKGSKGRWLSKKTELIK